ncbi:MAG: heparinase II/III family protein [Alphaproteobacteria bacterium]|nr:heparinase II/III family protein [Alphaproteobacteria bacterium]
MAAGTMLYDWSLGGPVPERLAVRPVDPWPGSAEAGRWLCEDGAFFLHGDRLPIRSGSWEPVGVSEAWMTHMHGFTWLRDLRAYSCGRGTGVGARQLARALVHNWTGHYRHWHPLVWRADITGLRLSMWLASHEFFGEEVFADPEEEQAFQDTFFDAAMRQARHLSRVLARGLPEEISGIGALQAAKGLLYAGMAFDFRGTWAEQALAFIAREIDVQILGDGAHASRSPSQLLEAMQIMLDVRMLLRAADYALPEKIQHAIDRMGPALRFFRYTDKYLALFNGSQEGDSDLLDCVAAQAGVRSKSLSSLPCAGFERVSQGRTVIVMDCGSPPPRALDRYAHAAPLAFEMCYGRERLLVNCGMHPLLEDWRESLRATAAHNTLVIEHRNAFEIKKDGHFARKSKKRASLREEARSAVLIEASHDGYVPLNGLVHRRRLYLSDHGQDLRGEDTLISAIEPARPYDVCVRFHLHPKIMVSLINEGQEALLRMQSGTGWRFHVAGGHMMLEDSLYMGSGGQPRKTKQLVICRQVIDKKNQIKWALQKEG